MKSPRKKARRITYRGAKKRLDRAHAKWIVQRSPVCFTCGSTENLQCGHLFSRVALSTRYDMLNCQTQCAGCNLLHEHKWKIFEDKFKEVFGEKALEALWRLHNTTRKFTTEELIAMAEEFEKQTKGRK